MSSRPKVSESARVEAQLSLVVEDILKHSDTYQKDFSFYWSKKSPVTAASVYKVFAADSDINVVRANAFDAIKFTLEVEGVEQEIEFTEKIISIKILGN